MAVRRNQYSDTQILAFQTTLQVLSAETSIAYITAPHKTPKIHDILTHAVRQIRAISAPRWSPAVAAPSRAGPRPMASRSWPGSWA